VSWPVVEGGFTLSSGNLTVVVENIGGWERERMRCYVRRGYYCPMPGVMDGKVNGSDGFWEIRNIK